MRGETDPPIVSIVGFSGAGKTTLLEKLIRVLTARGYRVGTIKHDVHGFEMDRPGKDSWRHKQAGAVVSMISSPQKIGMVRDVDHDHDPGDLKGLLGDVDIVFTEGYKKGDKPKVEVFRAGVEAQPLCLRDDHLIALVTDADLDLGVPRFALDDMEGLADFLTSRFTLRSATRPQGE